MERRHPSHQTPARPTGEHSLAKALIGQLDQGLSTLDEATTTRLEGLRHNALAHIRPSAPLLRPHHGQHTWPAWLTTAHLSAGIAILILVIALGLNPDLHDALTPAWTDAPVATRSMHATDDADEIPDDIPLYAFLDDGFSLWLQENTAHDTPSPEDNES